MADLVEAWKAALPGIKNGVTGVGVWTALNNARPVACEEGVLFLGLPNDMSDLAGHLRMAQTKRLIEQLFGKQLGEPISVRVIEGTDFSDVEAVKRKDAEARRLQDQQMAKMRAEIQSRTSWDSVYEQLSRRFAAVPNRSLPQNRARFYEEALELVAEARKGQEKWDDLAERNFARCVERVSQYADVPSTLVASHVLLRVGEL